MSERMIMGIVLDEVARDQAEWSQQTFGTDTERGPLGALRHLEREAREAQQAPSDLTEYADCLLLLLDASRRAGFTPLELLGAARDKMRVNRSRTWPKPVDGQPCEHVKADEKEPDPIPHDGDHTGGGPVG